MDKMSKMSIGKMFSFLDSFIRKKGLYASSKTRFFRFSPKEKMLNQKDNLSKLDHVINEFFKEVAAELPKNVFSAYIVYSHNDWTGLHGQAVVAGLDYDIGSFEFERFYLKVQCAGGYRGHKLLRSMRKDSVKIIFRVYVDGV